MTVTTRRRHSTPDIWPGFVDALATLLIIIIFLLMVFTLAQHFLSELLSGRTEALDRLNRQVTELAELLAIEQNTNTELRSNLSQISAQLQSTLASNEKISAQLSVLIPERDALKAVLSERTAERNQSQARVNFLETEQNDLKAILSERTTERNQLQSKLDTTTREHAKLSAETAALAVRKEKVDRALVDANKVIAADRAKIELQIRTLANLKRDITALETVRQDLETKVGALADTLKERDLALKKRDLALTAARDRSKELEARLSTEAERTRLAQRVILEKEVSLRALAARKELVDRALVDANKVIAADRAKIELQIRTLASLKRDITALETVRRDLESKVGALADTLKERDQTLKKRDLALKQRDLALTAARDRSKELEARLSTEAERTRLAQRDIWEKEVSLRALMRHADEAAAQLSKEQKMSAEASRRVALLNRQIAALRQQLARIAIALEASEAKAKAQNIQIINLGKRLNAALASKVEELSRFRSEFFGKLRRALGSQAGIHIVGDRFVFQSEVLFESGSATLAGSADHQIKRIADILTQVSARIPTDVDWVLRVDGHTDRNPIKTPRFPSNWELSTGRAISVVKQLVELGIPPNRLAPTGFGEHRPLDTGDTKLAHSRNRRIEFKLTGR